MRKFALSAAIVLALCGSASLQAQEYPTRVQISSAVPTKKILVNRDIVQMVRAKVSESTILEAIDASATNFDTSGSGIAGLKNSGVTETIIKVMITASPAPKAAIQMTPALVPVHSNDPAPRTAPTPAQPPALPPTQPSAEPTYVPEEIGVYVFAHGRWTPIEPEVASWKTGGVLKQTVTLGIDRQHIDGTVRKPHSPTDLTSAEGSGMLDFEIRCADGDSASEYQLLHFWEKSKRREFRTVTGGILHASGGAQNNVIDFSFEKIAPHAYRVQLKNLRAGDYGFLAPSTSASLTAASQGKVYTFRIIE